MLTTEGAGHLTSEIVQRKLNCFGTEAVEIKSNWLRIPYERERRYLEPFGITDERLTQFVDEYYEAIDGAELSFLAAVVDKKHMQEDYAKPWYAPALAYEVLLQRVQNEIPAGSGVSITIDDMTGATPHGNQFKANLTKQHMKLKLYGSALMKGFSFPCLRRRPAFVDSAQSHLIQVADIVAYNVNRQFIEYGEQWEDTSLTKLPTYGYLDRMSHKFRKDSEGRIQGYGIVKFPMRGRVRWCVKE